MADSARASSVVLERTGGGVTEHCVQRREPRLLPHMFVPITDARGWIAWNDVVLNEFCQECGFHKTNALHTRIRDGQLGSNAATK